MRLHLVVPGLLRFQQTPSPAPQGIRYPALGALLGRATGERQPSESLDRWLVRMFGLHDPDPPYAALRMLAHGSPGDSPWICADPVHVRFARDTLVLGAADELDLTCEEANDLVDTLNAHFADLGRFVVEAPTRWSLRLDRILDARTHPLDLVRGRQMQAFLPEGPDGRRLVHTLNEVQMLLHSHPVNARREAAGLAVANSVWFWGAGPLPAGAQAPVDRLVSDHPVARGLARLAGVPASSVPGSLGDAFHGEPEQLVTIEDLAIAAQGRDEARWHRTLARLEEAWFAPALKALKSGAIACLRISALQDEALVDFRVERSDLWKLWRRPLDPARAFNPPSSP